MSGHKVTIEIADRSTAHAVAAVNQAVALPVGSPESPVAAAGRSLVWSVALTRAPARREQWTGFAALASGM